MNDPNVTPDKKDYIYDLKETALFLVALVMLDGVTTKFKNDFWVILAARIVLFSTLFATAKEVFGGLNLSESGNWIFIGMNTLVAVYTILETWEIKKRKK